MTTNATTSHGAVSNWRLRLVLLLTAPVVVALSLLAGIAGVSMLRRPLYLEEMFVAALISMTVGILAVLPMALLINRGAVLLIRCAQLAIMIRLVGPVIGVIVVLMIPAWHANKEQLLIWLLVFYFVLYLAESVVSSWAFKHACTA
jgi:hypothetical protein